MSRYIPDHRLVRCVKKKNHADLSASLQIILNDNTLPDDAALDASKWAYTNFKEAFDDFDERITPPASNKELWTQDYYFHQMAYLNSNFCQERFNHLVEVRNYLRAQGDELFQRIKRPNSEKKEAAEAKKKKINSLLIVCGLIIFAVTLFLIN